MSTESLRTVKDRFSEFVDRVEHNHERVIVTKNGHAAAVLVSPEDLESLEETLAILSDPATMEGVRRAETEIKKGRYTEGVEAVRALRGKK